jgi:hypothetical protein
MWEATIRASHAEKRNFFCIQDFLQMEGFILHGGPVQEVTDTTVSFFGFFTCEFATFQKFQITTRFRFKKSRTLGDGSIGLDEFRYDCVNRMPVASVKLLPSGRPF